MAENQVIELYFQGVEIAKIGYDENRKKASFQYNPEFLALNIYKRLFPYIIKRTSIVQVFSEFEGETFRGLPPMIADSLPDYFGNIVFREWLESARKDLKSISPLEQLTYVGKRAMGALEFAPAKEMESSSGINIGEITEVVRKVLDLKTSVEEKGLTDIALLNIFKIGTSAGGARPKVLISEHKLTANLIPGDLVTSNEYNHYLIKLCIEENQTYSKEKVEYIYYKMAVAAGIDIMPSKLIEDKHFATLRFDRQQGEKIHVLTASGMTGWDFTVPEHSSYENLFRLANDLRVPHKDVRQLFRRMVFNLVFANTDDHLKNFSFMYDKQEDRWYLAPAYDLTYPLDALLNYTRVTRALSVNKKRTGITKEDLLLIADQFSVKDANGIIKEVTQVALIFRQLCSLYDIPEKAADKIESEFHFFYKL